MCPQFANAAQAEEFSDFLKSGLDDVFEDDLPTHDKLYRPWLQETSADEYKEDAIVVTGLGTMPEKLVGQSITVDKPYKSSTKVYTLRTWAIGYVAEYELTRWDLYGIFNEMESEMARSAVDRCNIQATAILNNAFSTANAVYTTYSGEALGSATHALLGGGTTTNRSATDAALSYAALQEARSDFMTMKNERGIYIRLRPKNLVVHPDNEWWAQTLMKSSLRPETADNDANVIKGDWKVVGDNPYLTAADAWFMTCGKKQLARSMRFRIGDKPKTRHDFDHSTWNSVRSCYQSNRVEVIHYQGLWTSQGDGA
jgi:hypothetical protein